MKTVSLKFAEVESIDDEADGMRIKARLAQDLTTPINDLPYAYPLLPKTLQTMPKVGECVLILTEELGNINSNRYYIGPVISQPQYQWKDRYAYGKGTANSLLTGRTLEPLPKYSKHDDTRGSFPPKDSVSLVGRLSEDVVLKDNELDLRCGIRNNCGNPNIQEGLVGNIIFNSIDPAYIQLKYKQAIGSSANQEANSVINLVADKINIISNKDVNQLNIHDKEELIPSKDMDDIMTKLHQVPYGDLLVEALNKIRSAVDNHVHPYPGLPPCKCQFVEAMDGIDFEKIKSKHVRIS